MLNVVVSVVSSSEGAVGVPWSRDPPDPKNMASLATLGPVQSSMGMLLFFKSLVAGWLLDRRHSRLGLPNSYSMHLFSKPFCLGEEIHKLEVWDLDELQTSLPLVCANLVEYLLVKEPLCLYDLVPS